MADNVAITPGAGATIAADDIAGVLWQRIKVGWGADGVAGDVTATNPLPVTAPAAARTTHSIGAAQMVDAIMAGLTALTPKFAKANVAASTTDSVIVAAVTSKVLFILAFRLHTGAGATVVTFNSKGAGAGTAISESFALGANGGHSPGFSPVGHFKTNTGEGLSVTTGAGTTTGVGVVYVEV